MAITRRDMVRGLGVGILGAGALSACSSGGRGRGRSKATTPPPTSAPLSEPDTPLVIGQIGAAYGRMAVFEEAIAVSLDEARIDINARWGGLFGQDIVLLERHVMEKPGEDLTPAIEAFRDAGATCLITSIDEESLIAAMPAMVEAGVVVIDVLTSGMSVRAPEVQTANLLIRMSPNDRILAAKYAQIALGANSDRGETPGTVAYISEDTAQGRSLLHELTQYLNPKGGKVVSEQFHPVGDMGDIAARVKAVMETPPALVVVNGGQECGPFLSALHGATLDEDGRPTVQLPIRLGPAAVVDYAALPNAKDLLPETLTGVTGYQPGAEITLDHEAMMLNRSSDFLRTGYAYSQQGYDALTMACLAAQDALSVTGTALAASLPAILTGSEGCTDYELCRRTMTEALKAQERATVAFSGRSGKLELGPESDARIGTLREYTWSKTNALAKSSTSNFEDQG